MCTPSRMYLHVELIGQEAHVIRDPELGINALKTAAEIIHQIPTGQVSKDQTINVFDPVSYTHLDVYKRQVYKIPPSDTNAVLHITEDRAWSIPAIGKNRTGPIKALEKLCMAFITFAFMIHSPFSFVFCRKAPFRFDV